MVFARYVAKTCRDQAVGAMFVSKNRSDSSKTRSLWPAGSRLDICTSN